MADLIKSLGIMFVESQSNTNSVSASSIASLRINPLPRFKSLCIILNFEYEFGNLIFGKEPSSRIVIFCGFTGRYYIIPQIDF